MQIFIYCKFTLHVSGVHRTHYQEYIKLLTAASGSGHSNSATTSLYCYYDLYQRLQLQFYVLLIMGVMDTRNM